MYCAVEVERCMHHSSESSDNGFWMEMAILFSSGACEAMQGSIPAAVESTSIDQIRGGGTIHLLILLVLLLASITGTHLYRNRLAHTFLRIHNFICPGSSSTKSSQKKIAPGAKKREIRTSRFTVQSASPTDRRWTKPTVRSIETSVAVYIRITHESDCSLCFAKWQKYIEPSQLAPFCSERIRIHRSYSRAVLADIYIVTHECLFFDRAVIQNYV